MSKALNIHTGHALSTGEDFIVYLPVRCYELTLKNRLLDQLGGFSHLLLEAMSQFPDHGIDWVLNVTGLSPQQLLPILKRLNELGLIDGERLSSRGFILALWKRKLHGQTRQVWLDGDHRNTLYFGDSLLETVELKEDSPFVVRRWRHKGGSYLPWSCDDWREDCERQKNRILNLSTQYLAAIFEDFTNCFIDSGFHQHEWELIVRFVNNDSGPRAIKFELDSGLLRQGDQCEYTFCSPVLCLTTLYSLPSGAPESLLEQTPYDHYQTASFIILNEDTLKPSQLHERPTSPWVWPEIDPDYRDQVIEYLFQQIDVNTENTERFFNRSHVLKDRWRSLGFDWSTIEPELKTNGLHRIHGDGA